MFLSHILPRRGGEWHSARGLATDLECLHSRLRVLLLDTKPWGKMEAPIWGPSTCVVLDHLKDGGGEEGAMRFTHICLSGGQR